MPVVLAPAEVLAGLVAICVLFAAYLIAQIISAVIDGVNIFGILDPIKSAANWLATHTLSAMGWLWSKTNPVAVWTALVNIWHDTEQGLHGVLFGDINGALQWLYHTAIPAAVSYAIGTVRAIYDPFVSGVNAFIQGVLGFITWVHTQLASLWLAVTVTLPGLVRQAEAVAAADLGAAVHAVEGDIAAAEQAATHALAVAIAGIEAWTGSQIGTAVRGIEGDLGAVRDLVTGLALPEIAILSQTLTRVIADATAVEECVAGICSTGTGNILGDLGKLLQGLAPLIEGGVLFALLAEAVADAPAVAHDIEAVIGGTVNGAATALRDAVGLAA